LPRFTSDDLVGVAASRWGLAQRGRLGVFGPQVMPAIAGAAGAGAGQRAPLAAAILDGRMSVLVVVGSAIDPKSSARSRRRVAKVEPSMLAADASGSGRRDHIAGSENDTSGLGRHTSAWPSPRHSRKASRR
jgi:hypothetical protein